jgi:hypothetical protein
MKAWLFVFVLGILNYTQAQTDTVRIPESSLLFKLSSGDSLYYYQCHVEEAVQQLSTVSGQTLTGKPQKYSISEKFVVIKELSGYRVNYYSSSITAYPNRKFSGLKIREKSYWEFKFEKCFKLSDDGLKALLALERKGHEATEYDFTISKYNSNQLIIKHKKNFKQLVIEGTYTLTKLLLPKTS